MAVGSKRVLSDGEVRRLLEVVAEQPWRTLVKLMLFVGLRRSEVLELRVADVAGATVRVESRTPRRAQWQVMSLPADVAADLQELVACRGEDDLVFGGVVVEDEWRRAWPRFTAVAGLDGVRLHTLRSTFTDRTSRLTKLHASSPATTMGDPVGDSPNGYLES